MTAATTTAPPAGAKVPYTPPIDPTGSQIGPDGRPVCGFELNQEQAMLLHSCVEAVWSSGKAPDHGFRKVLMSVEEKLLRAITILEALDKHHQAALAAASAPGPVPPTQGPPAPPSPVGGPL